MRKIKLGTRGSRLALAQVKEITSLLPKADYELVIVETSGDKDKVTPLDQVEGSDFFSDSLEKALLEREIDLAVHSAKDLPVEIRPDLEIVLTTQSIDEADVLVSRQSFKLDALPKEARIGTSSRSRKEQVLKLRPDLIVKDLRGNIDERLEKLDQGEYEVIIVAAAALKRLGLSQRITERLDFSTAKGQGCLAVQIRANDGEIKQWLEKFI